MSTAEKIRTLQQRVELLAPAGGWEALEAVLDAGADAVYVGPRGFHMRRNRTDFHFTDARLAEAITLAHGRGRRVYVTVNSLLGDAELPEVRELLGVIEGLGADAIIVQDLAVVEIAAELGCRVPLHASTMMNVHHAEQARTLKALGVSRIVASRDISVHDAGEIGRLADVEMEVFVHGDMCVSQAGQCNLSGVLFGKSAHRGRCFKPCRWTYDLVRQGADGSGEDLAHGYLLATKDLCLIQDLPTIARCGISAVKIEGRMREPEYLAALVGAYRQALDAWYANPAGAWLPPELMDGIWERRVRDLSTLTMLGGPPRREHLDPSGEREPPRPSTKGHEPGMEQHLEIIRAEEPHPGMHPERDACVDLAVSVADAAAAAQAIDAGADRIYLAAEASRRGPNPWSPEAAAKVIAAARDRGVKVGIRTPRLSTPAEMEETRWFLAALAREQPDYVLAHNLGTVALARRVLPEATLIADFGHNVVNGSAAGVLKRLGAGQVVLSCEAGLSEMRALAHSSPVALEVMAHGPVNGMLTDLCVIALFGTPEGTKELCRQPCTRADYRLRDASGEARTVIPDHRCRNHILTGHDLATLPRLDLLLLPQVASLRIEGQYYEPAYVGAVTRAYRLRLKAMAHVPGDGIWKAAWAQVRKEAPRPFNLGPFVHTLVEDVATMAS